MGKKVTIQDIATELGLSRNTVSKALNNYSGLADGTRERILKKAMEMGYKQFVFFPTDQVPSLEQAGAQVDGPNEIALLTTIFIDRDHFASLTLDQLQNDLSRKGYTLNTHRVAKEDISELKLPPTVKLEKVAAFICIEVFDHAYADMVCDLDVPTLFMDGPAKHNGYRLRSDQVYMNNYDDIMRLVHDMVASGVRRIGFIGDWGHCQSFNQRYNAFRLAMIEDGLPVDDRDCIRANRAGRMHTALAKLDDYAELYICANDFVATDAIRAFGKLGMSVPDDVLVSGFDDSSSSRHWIPSLTTVHIHTQSIAYSAMQLLATRMQEPSLEYREVYTSTSLIYRDSTKRS